MVAGVGLAIIFLYSVQYRLWPDGRVLSTLSVGLVSAGAAWLIGVLLGFLFGIPHTKEGKPETSKLGSGTAGEQSENDDRYSQSTSLEQISDWLTKIIVGVGLTQLNYIPRKLDQLAEFVAGGLGGDKPNSAFALGIILYFAVCGFLFGYLWGRLYMLGLFREADLEKRLKQVEEFNSQMLDQRAKDLVERQLNLNDAEVDATNCRKQSRRLPKAKSKKSSISSVRQEKPTMPLREQRAVPFMCSKP